MHATMPRKGRPEYPRTVGDYVYLNPVRTRLLWPEDRLPAHPWNTFPLYLATPEHRHRWLRVDRLKAEHGIRQDAPSGAGKSAGIPRAPKRFAISATHPSFAKRLECGVFHRF
jgi:hypothetical protein